MTQFQAYVPTPRHCLPCGQAALAQAYDRLGNSDSAVAVELYEERGDRTKARDFYARFVEVWKDAVAELKPGVSAVQERLRHLPVGD